jgi:hypothetical protein
MEHLSAPAVVFRPTLVCDGSQSLSALAGSVLADRFHAWPGASGRRYTVSVYAVDRDAEDIGLPEFDGFVLIPVVRDGFARRPLAVVAVERDADRRVTIAEALVQGVDEWHVHLLAGTRDMRRAIVADVAATRGGLRDQALSA